MWFQVEDMQLSNYIADDLQQASCTLRIGPRLAWGPDGILGEKITGRSRVGGGPDKMVVVLLVSFKPTPQKGTLKQHAPVELRESCLPNTVQGF